MTLKIRELREESYLSQTQLAEQLHTTQRNISHWEKGVSEPDFETVMKIADFFDVTLDELFGRNADACATVAETSNENLENLIKKLNMKQISAIKNLVIAFGI